MQNIIINLIVDILLFFSNAAEATALYMRQAQSKKSGACHFRIVNSEVVNGEAFIVKSDRMSYKAAKYFSSDTDNQIVYDPK